MRVRDTITVSDWFVLLCTSNCRYRKSSFKTPLQISPPPRLSTLYVGWSDMVYSRSGNWDLPLIFGGITSNFICSSFSTLRSSSFWRIDTKFWLFEKAVWRPGTIYRPSRNFAGGNAFRITPLSNKRPPPLPTSKVLGISMPTGELIDDLR